MRAPAGLGEAGRKLWRSMHDTFDFDEEPHKVQILRQTCRVADVIDELRRRRDCARQRWPFGQFDLTGAGGFLGWDGCPATSSACGIRIW